jgi:sugar phosphate isomerase/epimerase
MRLGISTWSYPWSIGIPGYPLPDRPMQAADLLAKAHGFGVDLVQICDNLPYNTLSEEQLDEIRRMADDLGISLELGTRGIHPEHLRQTLPVADRLRAARIRTTVDTPDPAVASEWVNAVVSDFSSAGVTLAIETGEILSAREYAYVIAQADSPSVGILLDTANSLGRLERLEELVATLAPHVVEIHYKDYAVQRVQQAPPVVRMGFEITGMPAGQGWVDFDWLVESVLRGGRDPDLVLELWPPFLGTIAATVENEQRWVETSVTFLQGKLSARSARSE